jgi:hypothetical protein
LGGRIAWISMGDAQEKAEWPDVVTGLQKAYTEIANQAVE